MLRPLSSSAIIITLSETHIDIRPRKLSITTVHHSFFSERAAWWEGEVLPDFLFLLSFFPVQQTASGISPLPCRVVFFSGLATNVLNVRNNNVLLIEGLGAF